MIFQETERKVLEEIPDGFQLQNIPFFKIVDSQLVDCFVFYLFEKREDDLYKRPVGYCFANGEKIESQLFENEYNWEKSAYYYVSKESAKEYRASYVDFCDKYSKKDSLQKDCLMTTRLKDNVNQAPNGIKELIKNVFSDMTPFVF